jgi:LptA/(LptD N-terminal domain) LPS transport protein
MKIVSVCVFIGLFFIELTLANESQTLPKLKYSADKIIQDKDAVSIQLIGHAQVTQGDQIITGQKIVLNLKTESITAIDEASPAENRKPTDAIAAHSQQMVWLGRADQIAKPVVFNMSGFKELPLIRKDQQDPELRLTWNFLAGSQQAADDYNLQSLRH